MIIKRLIDLFVSSALIIVLSPVFVLISLIIKFTSKGPILYNWNVVGLNGIYFKSYKFRTMVVNADQIKGKLGENNEMTGPVFKMTKDPRITKFGRILRKYSLDEIPQLWSVFSGKMSLVGPRPPLQTEYSDFNDWQKKKLAVKPGITCLWQVNGRNDISSFDDWVKLDLEYIENQSFLLDMKILLKTIPAVLKGTGK